MSARLLHPDEYELGARSSVDSQGSFDLDEADFESQAFLSRPSALSRRFPALWRIFHSSFAGYRRLKVSRPLVAAARPYRPFLRRIAYYLRLFVGFILVLLLLTYIFRPSYTLPPSQYRSLQASARQSTSPGRGNPRNEQVFLAASLYDPGGDLVRGKWGEKVLQLIELLGANNVFLSVYENGSGPEGENALRDLEGLVSCNRSIVFEEQLHLGGLNTVTVPGGEQRIKRIEYLAEVRNRALRPLDAYPEKHYDKLLYLNDVIFDPVDAVQLLFSTNADENGIARYRSACAVDFINPFKFYDTFATRDLQGYGMGLPFFPWFSTAGRADSRNDVLNEKDAVRVRSCWGGMVAFDAKFFQSGRELSPTDSGLEKSPVRFRASRDLFWESSECCLVHSDIQEIQPSADNITDTGVYLNPYVRVAYDSATLSWLHTTRRFEKLYSLIHNVGNHLVGLPWFNSRRTQVAGQPVQEPVWVTDPNDQEGGSFKMDDRVAGNDGFCARRGLQVLVEHREEGQKGWENIPIPST